MAFRGDSTATYTFTSGNGSTVDLGARNNYRYVNATNVYNKGKSDGGGLSQIYSQLIGPSLTVNSTKTVTIDNSTDYLLLWYSTESTVRYITVTSGADIIGDRFTFDNGIFGYRLLSNSTSLTVKANGGTIHDIGLIKLIKFTNTNWIEYTIGSSGLTLNMKQGDRLIWRGGTTDWISVNGQRCDYGDGGYSFTVQGWTLEKAYCEPGSTWKSCFVCTVNTTGSYSMTGNNNKFLYLPA